MPLASIATSALSSNGEEDFSLIFFGVLPGFVELVLSYLLKDNSIKLRLAPAFLQNMLPHSHSMTYHLMVTHVA